MIPEVEPRLIFARCVAPALADDATREHLDSEGDFGRGNHDGGESSAQQNQTTSVSPKKANPWRGRQARQTAGRGAGAA